MSRRQFLQDMRLDTRLSDEDDSRRESLVCSPIAPEEASSIVAAHAVTSTTVRGDDANTAVPAAVRAGITAHDKDSQESDAAAPAPLASAGDDLTSLFLARARSNTIPFNYRPAAPPGAAAGDTAHAATDSAGVGSAGSPNRVPADCSPYSSPRTARPGGSRVPSGPVPLPSLEDGAHVRGAADGSGRGVGSGPSSTERTPSPRRAEAVPTEATEQPSLSPSPAVPTVSSEAGHCPDGPGSHARDGVEELVHRARSGSITRIENTLIAAQVELAREKKNNIDAEQRLHALAREVETLQAENARLAAALGEAARRSRDTSDLTTGAASPHYVAELEKTVQQLSKSIAAKDEALAVRDERIRLLEHRLVDHVLAGEGGLPGVGQSPEAARSFARATSPSTSLSHIREVRGSELVPYDSRADAPPAVVTVASKKLDIGGASREVGTSATRRRATDADVSALTAQSHTHVSPRRRANSGVVVPSRESDASAPPRRTSVIRRKGSTASAIEPSRNTTGRIVPSTSPAASSARTTRKASVVSSVDTSLNKGSTPLRRRASAAGPPASPARRGSAMRRDCSTSSLSAAAPPLASERRGSAARRSSVKGSHGDTTRRASGAHPVQLQRAPNVASAIGTSSGARASMLASYATPYRGSVSPTRSVAPSMRSATSTRSRPQISFSAKDDITTMKGTTTTVVFRSRSPAATDFTPSRSPYTTALTPEREPQPFVSTQFAETTYHANRLVRTPQEESIGG